MKNKFDYAIRFKNGNIHIKWDNEHITEVKNDQHESVLIHFLWDLECVDTYLYGEEYCCSNYEMGISLYSAYSGFVYRFGYNQLDKLLSGKTVILKAVKPDEYDIEDLTKEGFYND